MKKILVALSSIAVLGLFTTACDETVNLDPCTQCATNEKCYMHKDGVNRCKPACSPDLQWNPNEDICIPKTLKLCKTDGDCENANQTCDTTKKYCVEKQVGEKIVKFVRIDDLSAPGQSVEDPGADIDAVVLQKKNGGGSFYATAVKAYSRGDGQSTQENRRAYDPKAILGKPDSFDKYPTDAKTCNYYVNPQLPADERTYTFVSLGGKLNDRFGYIVVEMGEKIEDGDILTVLEVGNCKLANTSSSNGNTANAEEVAVFVSVSDNIKDGIWKPLGKGKGVADFTIKASDLQF